MTTAIWWARRDLRLHDNFALGAALAHGDTVIPVFVLDPALLRANAAAGKRLAFLFGGLRALDADLRARGSRLIVRTGSPGDELAALREETGAGAIYAEADPWPYARERDAAVARHLPLAMTEGITVRPYDAISKAAGGPYTVFTPYSRAWKSLPLPVATDLRPPPDRLAAPPQLGSAPIPDGHVAAPFPPGEAEALRRLAVFAEGRNAPIAAYGDARNWVDLQGTSELSPYLRFGMVSALRASVAALSAAGDTHDAGARQSAGTWLNELIWREFYAAILYHFPNVRQEAFRANLRNIPWQNDPAGFAAWKAGLTGYPVVDAAMRQLKATGWMHNRARMISASFLTKDLLINWQEGERYFMQSLLDGDPASNNGGWQWTAGTGTDAAPYFRVFNPILQGLKFDPKGDYVRRWVPELGLVPTKYIHSPWEMPAELQKQLGFQIDSDYPAPIVDHKFARERVLLAYRSSSS